MSFFKGKELLVIDDEAKTREHLRAIFTKEQANVTLAHDGSEALWNIKHRKFDVILTEVKVSKISGIQLISIVKTSKNNPKTPIFVLTGQLDDQSVRKISRLGIASVIAKPFDDVGICRIIRNKLREIENKSFYDPNVIKAFVAAVRDVLSFYLDESPSIGKPFREKKTGFDSAVSGIIGFSSSMVMGSMSMSLDEKFLNLLISQIFGPDADEEVTENAFADVAGELCNQVLGKVRTNFGKLGIKIEMGLPEVIVGTNHNVVHKVNGLLIGVPVTVKDGTCVTEFTMTKSLDDYDGSMDYDDGQGNWLSDGSH